MFYPADGRRKAYDLRKSFIGFGDKKIYRSGDKLMGWWRLDNNNYTTDVGGNATDSSRFERHGTFSSDSERPTFSASLGPSDFIQTGSAGFNNTRTAVNIGSGNLWNGLIGNDTGNGSTQKFTLAAWVYKVDDGQNNFGRIFDFGNNSMSLYTNTSDEIKFNVRKDQSGTGGSSNAVLAFESTGNSFGINQWVHIAVTFDAEDPDADPLFYVNGSPGGTAALTLGSKGGTNYGINTSKDCFIGDKHDKDRTWDGNLADLAVWNTILEPEEISAIYNASKYEEDFGPGYSDNLNDVQEMPSLHKVHRNSAAAIGIKSITPHRTVTELKRGLNNQTFARSEQLSSSNSFLLASNNGGQTRLERFLIPAMTGAGGPGRSVNTAGEGGAGFSWSGWVKMGAKNANEFERLWTIGNMAGNSGLMKFTKRHAGGVASCRWRLVLDTQTNGELGKENVWEWESGIDFSGSWNHLALVWGRPDDGTIRAQPPANGNGTSTAAGTTLETADSGATFYLNGVSQSYVSYDSDNGHQYETTPGTKTDVRGFSNTVSGNTAMFIGGLATGGNSDSFAIQASFDEWSFWTIALDSGSIQSLYNNGTPCDLTQSAAYENSGTFLYDWIRFDNAADSTAFVVDASNPGTFSDSNKLVGWRTSSWIPMGNAGGPNWTVSAENFLTGCQAITTASVGETIVYQNRAENDNYYVQHMIPRSDRQYSWMTGAMEDQNPRNVRFSGYMPIFGPQQGLYKSSSTVYEPYLTFISESEFGYTRTTLNSADSNYDFAVLGAIKNSTFAAGYDWKGQDFAGLNTMIREPIEASASMANTLGWPTAVHASRGQGTPISRFLDNATDPGDQYRNVRFFNPPPSGYGGFWGDVVGGVSASYLGFAYGAIAQHQGYLFNTLMLKRNGPYGYGTHAQVRRNPNHPVLRSERSSSMISVYNNATNQIEKYPLSPVSSRAQPTLVNYTPYDPSDELGRSANPQASNDSITLKITDVNEKIMFNDIGLNNVTKIDPKEIVTPLDHILLITSKHVDYGLNWMAYSEKVFPSARNENVSHSSTRTGFNMKQWRDERRLRNELGNEVNPSVGRAAAAEFFASARMDYCSQSAWPLDASVNFLTRTGSIVGSINSLFFTASQRPSPFKGASVNRNYLRAGPFTQGGSDGHSTVASSQYPNVQIAISNAAGELQNNYGHAHFAHDAGHGGRGSKYDGQFSFISCGGLYARKHMLGPFLSVGNPTGMETYTTGNLGIDGQAPTTTTINYAQLLTQSVPINTGEALWEAGTNAGILRKSGKGFTFIHKPSKPWYDNYEEFRDDIRYLARDYVIVPEFRISENIKDFSQLDLDENDKFDTFEIPGTDITSETGEFYSQYMNSSKMTFFRQQGLKTDLTAKEIKISVKAVKKWNPYKGFYPAQRTLDLVSQFSSSYHNSIQMRRVGGLSDGSDWTPNANFPNGAQRPIYQPLFMPGILYNSIKSGMAVDWPAIFGSVSKGNAAGYINLRDPSVGTSGAGSEKNPRTDPANLHTWMIHTTAALDITGSEFAQYKGIETGSAPWVQGTTFWDTRLPFETILAPEANMTGEDFIDLEPHPSATVDFSASIVGNNNDSFYTLMARNFFGETANFFLRGRTFSELQSGEILGNTITFKAGTVYGSRLKLKRSLGNFSATPQTTTDGDSGDNPSGDELGVSFEPQGGTTRRYYSFDRDAWGSTYPNSAYSAVGGRYFDTVKNTFISGASYELPQDPIHPYIAMRFTGSVDRVAGKDIVTRESFTMYSRPSAFGPPVSGRPLKAHSHPGLKENSVSASLYGVKDSMEGYNWAYTPPYYHGEAWMDLIFRPTKTQYTLEEVLEEIETQCWRVDPGPVISKNANDKGTTAFISSSYTEQCIMDGRNVNAHAMQVSASLNVFGIKKESFLQTDQFGNPNSQRNETNSTRWVIKPKYETPMLNFSSSFRPQDLTASLPLFGSASVPNGMWHQFGMIEPNRNRGIFMEIGDIPKNWLKYHYMVRNTASLYNDNDVSKGESVHTDMRSLSDVFKFSSTPVRLGEIARRKILREAVVAIPYRNVLLGNNSLDASLNNRTRKEFFGIEPFRVAAALAANAGTATGQSLDVAGESIRRLVRKMKKYILPPQFDFLRNPEADPIAMYIFDFHYKLDKDDLSYIWQNLAPRDYKKVRFQESSIAHELNNTELLDAEELMSKDVQWMIFKVKQKATGDYFKHVLTQIGESNTKMPNQLEDIARKSLQYNIDFSENIEDDEVGNGVIADNTYELQYNWPYDYISIVEGIKVEVEVLYDDKIVKTTNLITEEIDQVQKKAHEATNAKLPDPVQVAKAFSDATVPQIALDAALDQLGISEQNSVPAVGSTSEVEPQEKSVVKFSMAPAFGGGLNFSSGMNFSSNNQGGNQGGGKK